MKKKNWYLGLIFSFLFLLSPNLASAAEGDSKTSDPVVTVENLSVGGENFELSSWIDEQSGQVIYTISSEVKDKVMVAEYVNELIENRNQKIELMNEEEGKKYNWSRSLANTNGLGRVTWGVSGYSEAAYLYPITEDVMRVNDGELYAGFSGAGLADKIILDYSYTFNGTTLTISIPPALTKTSNKVSWKSSTITGKWYVNTASLWAKATSRVSLNSTEIRYGADIYKGSNIYRPNTYASISFGGS